MTTKGGARRLTRACAAIVVIALISGGCGASEASAPPGIQSGTNQPTTTPTLEATTPTTLPSPSPSAGRPEPPSPAPLPDAELATIEGISAGLYERAQAEQVVVSMLDLLGIGLYEADGSVIRAGSERSDADFFVFEPEVRGLVELLKSSVDQERWVAFRDFHAALADLGFQGSAEELATAYNAAYEADYEAPMTQLVYGLGGVDVEAPLHPLAPWLLFLDGFVPPNGDQAAIAMTGNRPATAGLRVAANPASWGLARDRIAEISSLPLEADPLVIAHLMGVVASGSVVVSATPGLAHEGHGGPGAPVTLSASVNAVASTFVSPFSRRPLIPLNPVPGAGLPVTWLPDPALERHGSVTLPSGTVTDPLGRNSITFTPRQEAANGEGYLTREVATIQASVPGALLVTQLYGVPSLGALVGGEVRGLGLMDVEWHAAEAMRISLVEDYDVTIDLIIATGHTRGRDTFEGLLALQEDGTWRGIATGTATGSHQTQALGQPCSASWSASQLVEVVGEAAPYALNGDFYFRFMPVTQPSGSMGSGKCPPSVGSYEGVDYAPYNDYSISAAAEKQGLVIILPQKPGGTRDYPIKLPGVVDATWRVTIEFLEPP